jgi:hypothetical protein
MFFVQSMLRPARLVETVWRQGKKWIEVLTDFDSQQPSDHSCNAGGERKLKRCRRLSLAYLGALNNHNHDL